MTSPDLTDANVDRLADIFPAVVTETLDPDGNPVKAINLDLLRQELLRIAGWHQTEDVFIARERHLRALSDAQEHIAAARNVVETKFPALELFAEELRLAQQSLGQITGEFTADDLLGVIFSRFCIGK